MLGTVRVRVVGGSARNTTRDVRRPCHEAIRCGPRTSRDSGAPTCHGGVAAEATVAPRLDTAGDALSFLWGDGLVVAPAVVVFSFDLFVVKRRNGVR